MLAGFVKLFLGFRGKGMVNKALCVLFTLFLGSLSVADALQDDIVTVGLWHMESIYYTAEDIPMTADDDTWNPSRNHDLVLFRSGLNETPPTVVSGYAGNALLFEGGQFSNCPSFWSSSYNEIVVDYIIYISAVPTELGAATTYLFSSSVFEMGLWPGSSGATSDFMRFKIVLSSGDPLTPEIVVGDLKDRWLHIVGSYDSSRNFVFSITDTTTGIERLVTGTGSYSLKAASSDITFGSTSPSLGSKPTNRNFRGMIDEVKISNSTDVPHYAYNPIPADNSTIVETPDVLAWSRGLVAEASDVYFDDNQAAVTNALKLTGDIDGSTTVDLQDAGHMAATWQNTPQYPCADLDFSGLVDMTDLLMLIDDWLAPSDPIFLGSTPNAAITNPDASALSPSTTYYWRVDSANCNEIESGNLWQFTTGPAEATEPYPEDYQTAVAISSDKVSLEWTPGFGATSFDIYFGTSGSPSLFTSVSATSVDSPSLQPETTYYWRVDSTGPQGTTNGNNWRFTTGAIEAINPSPEDEATEIQYPFEGVQLAWTSVFEPDSYEVYFGTQNPPPYYDSTTEITIMSPAVSSNTTYYWRVNCISSHGNVTGPVWEFKTTTPAFPTAEGFGRFAKGGRGGSVYHVTNLNDSGTGSLRDAVSSSDRTIVFDVGGQITLSSRLGITANRLTIAGQTAPGDGISIVGPGISIGADDMIMRYVRVRYTNNASQDDAMSLNNTCSNDIFDHISTSWGTDEVFSMDHSQNITAQWCMITEGQNILGHSKGSLLEMPVLSMHHCLYAHNNDRNPKNKGEFDYRNNVAYDWGFAPYIAGGGTGAQCHANCVGNYYIAGDSTTTDDGIMVITGNSNYHMYFDDNRIDSDRDGIADGVDLGIAMLQPTAMPDVVSTPYNFPPVETDSPELAYQRVLSRVGCSIVRDSVDLRIIDQVVNQTGGIIYSYEDVGGPGTLTGGTAPTDTDQDGMPDYWEDSITGLNSAVADNNGDLNGDGYTNLEDYLNWLAAPHANVEKNESVDIDLINYTSGFDAGTYTVFDPVNGGVVLLGDGHTARFTPDTDFTGLAQFSYTIDNGTTMTEVVSLLVSDSSIIPPEPLAAPTGLVAIGGDDQVSLSWNANSEAHLAGYNLYRTTTSGSGYTQVNSTLITSTAYTDSSASNGTLYHYILTAEGTAGNESLATPEISAMPENTDATIIIQENRLGFCNVDGTIDSNNAGYTGDGFANGTNGTSYGIDWSVNIATAGTYTLTWRYANGTTTDRPGRLLVDDSVAVSSISLAGTGGWTTWDTVSQTVSLTTGVREIRLEATTSNGLANIDYIMISGADPQPASCP